MNRYWAFFIGLLILLGCKAEHGKEKGGGGGFGILSPKTPTVSSGVIAIYKAPEGARVQWFLNGEPLDFHGDTLDSTIISPYDTVSAELILPKGRKSRLGKVVVLNRPPRVLNVEIKPEKPRFGEDLWVDVEAEDPDHQDLEISVEWFVNGEPVHRGETLPGRMIKAGDVISCRVVVSDGYLESRRIQVNAPWIVQNTPPVVESQGSHWSNNVFTMPLRVSDPDGDRVSLEIVRAPEGLVLRNDTIYYKLDKDTTFSSQVVILAKDPHGGETRFSFKLEVKKKRQ